MAQVPHGREKKSTTISTPVWDAGTRVARAIAPRQLATSKILASDLIPLKPIGLLECGDLSPLW